MDLIDLKMEEAHGSTPISPGACSGNSVGALAGARAMIMIKEVSAILGCKEHEIATRIQLVRSDHYYLKEVSADALKLLDILIQGERPPTGVVAFVRGRLVKALERSDLWGVEP